MCLKSVGGYLATPNIRSLIQVKAKRDQKAGENLRARSLAFYNEKYSPEICVRTSLADYKQTENLYDVPLYMVGSMCY